MSNEPEDARDAVPKMHFCAGCGKPVKPGQTYCGARCRHDIEDVEVGEERVGGPKRRPPDARRP